MITVARARYYANYRKTIYESMIDSTSIEERANAEAPRLASYAWSQVAILLITPLDPDFAPNINKILEDIIEKWEKYCKTGIPQNDIADAVHEMQRKMYESVKLVAPVAPEAIMEALFSSTEAIKKPIVPAKSKKNTQVVESTPKPDSVIQEPVDNEIRSVINVEAINMYIDEISEECLNTRTAFIEMQEQAIKDADKVQEAISG